jgi:hypothetical protein
MPLTGAFVARQQRNVLGLAFQPVSGYVAMSLGFGAKRAHIAGRTKDSSC